MSMKRIIIAALYMTYPRSMAMTSWLLYWVPKSGWPVIISYPNTPRDHRSAAGEAIMVA